MLNVTIGLNGPTEAKSVSFLASVGQVCLYANAKKDGIVQEPMPFYTTVSY